MHHQDRDQICLVKDLFPSPNLPEKTFQPLLSLRMLRCVQTDLMHSNSYRDMCDMPRSRSIAFRTLLLHAAGLQSPGHCLMQWHGVKGGPPGTSQQQLWSSGEERRAILDHLDLSSKEVWLQVCHHDWVSL